MDILWVDNMFLYMFLYRRQGRTGRRPSGALQLDHCHTCFSGRVFFFCFFCFFFCENRRPPLLSVTLQPLSVPLRPLPVTLQPPSNCAPE